MGRGVSQYIYRYINNILFVGGRLTPRSVKKLLRLGEWVSYALIAIIIITNIIIIILIRLQIIEEQKEHHLLRVSIRFIVIS